MSTGNWIPDVNRFNLAPPPVWFLSALKDFDDSLVIIPSRQQALYRLAQRRRINLPEKMLSDPFFQESDTKMLASYGLVPVTSIMPSINWADPENFMELARRAPHRQGGADEVMKKLEEQEAREEISKAAAQDDMLTGISKDAWGMYQKKIGVRSHMFIPRRKSDLVRKSKSPSIRVK